MKLRISIEREVDININRDIVVDAVLGIDENG